MQTTTTNEPTNKEIAAAGFDADDSAMIRALCDFLDCKPYELTKEKYDYYGMALFSYGREEYAIGTEEEADSACREYVENSAWAFNASFILSECGLPGELEESIQSFQEKEYKSANDTIVAIIKKTCGMESFVESAISADGRGHFLAQYDGDENEQCDFFIYRKN